MFSVWEGSTGGIFLWVSSEGWLTRCSEQEFAGLQRQYITSHIFIIMQKETSSKSWVNIFIRLFFPYHFAYAHWEIVITISKGLKQSSMKGLQGQMSLVLLDSVHCYDGFPTTFSELGYLWLGVIPQWQGEELRAALRIALFAPGTLPCCSGSRISSGSSPQPFHRDSSLNVVSFWIT